ncbi:MAG: hypothetical protein D3909_09345 [Candidatus Electrothrix sp. ATG1]|nr:hypothetical protein [Candidatus Electrothrix sp. ATG1]MCI5209472.1 hypothetical protein [Candidatus Electrothrix sp. ATG2]
MFFLSVALRCRPTAKRASLVGVYKTYRPCLKKYLPNVNNHHVEQVNYALLLVLFSPFWYDCIT